MFFKVKFLLLEVETKNVAAETASIKISLGSGCLSVFMSSLERCIVCFIPQKPNRGKGLQINNHVYTLHSLHLISLS